MNKNIIVFGTRPEFIKLLPLFSEIEKHALRGRYIYLFTGQHHELTKNLFEQFDFEADYTISAKAFNNSIGESFSHILKELQVLFEELKKKHQLNYIIGQGDTTSCACAAFCAFLNEIPFAHIEAGLRTGDLNSPFPEEYFRRIISNSSTLHFAPTPSAVKNLIGEGVAHSKIILSGNTLVDAVHLIRTKFKIAPDKSDHKKVIITCHRRENQNGKFEELINCIVELARLHPEFDFIWISHSNPFIQEKLILENHIKPSNLIVSEPVSVIELYRLYSQTKVIITDSGGIQEEAVSFQLPVIVIRDATERTESIEKGYSILCKNIKDELIPQFNSLLKKSFSNMDSPYGDGTAARKIISYLHPIIS